jgi:hypothetical protein
MPSGTTVNATSGTGATESLRYVKSSGNNIPATVITFSVTGSGLSDFVITYAAYEDGPGGQYATQNWEYRVDGGAWQPGPTVGNLDTTTWTLHTADFSTITAINDQATVGFRFTATASHKDISLNFDNFQINAVPEPSQVIALAGGLGLLGIVEWRRRRRRVR